MREWTRLKDDEAESDLAFALVVDAELFRLDSVVRWLEVAEERLRRAEADGWPPAPVAPAGRRRRRRPAGWSTRASGSRPPGARRLYRV